MHDKKYGRFILPHFDIFTSKLKSIDNILKSFIEIIFDFIVLCYQFLYTVHLKSKKSLTIFLFSSWVLSVKVMLNNLIEPKKNK